MNSYALGGTMLPDVYVHCNNYYATMTPQTEIVKSLNCREIFDHAKVMKS